LDAVRDAFGVPQGVWTASVAKRSAAPAAIEITVTFTPA
jgi:hypothetical protein